MRNQLIYIFILTFLVSACKTIVPKAKTNYKKGFYYQYDKLDFDKIANSTDTTWQKQVKPLADLMLRNPSWTVIIKTFLADSSSLPFESPRLDIIVVKKIADYLRQRGIDYQKVQPFAYNNCDDSNRRIYQGPNAPTFKKKKFKKNTFEWEILRIDPP